MRDEEASPFHESNQSMVSYLTAAEITNLLLEHIEQRDLDDDGGLAEGGLADGTSFTESDVEAALEQLQHRQRDGEPLGILCRHRLNKPVAWRIVPPAIDGESGPVLVRIRLHEYLHAEPGERDASATVVLAAVCSTDSLRDVLTAIAAAAAPLVASPIDAQMLVTVAQDVISQAEVSVCAQRLAAEEGPTHPRRAPRTAAKDGMRNSPPRPTSRRRASDDNDSCDDDDACNHDADATVHLQTLVHDFLAKMITGLLDACEDHNEARVLREQRDSVTAYACEELTRLQCENALLAEERRTGGRWCRPIRQPQRRQPQSRQPQSRQPLPQPSTKLGTL